MRLKKKDAFLWLTLLDLIIFIFFSNEIITKNINKNEPIEIYTIKKNRPEYKT